MWQFAISFVLPRHHIHLKCQGSWDNISSITPCWNCLKQSLCGFLCYDNQSSYATKQQQLEATDKNSPFIAHAFTSTVRVTLKKQMEMMLRCYLHSILSSIWVIVQVLWWNEIFRADIGCSHFFQRVVVCAENGCRTLHTPFLFAPLRITFK